MELRKQFAVTVHHLPNSPRVTDVYICDPAIIGPAFSPMRSVKRPLTYNSLFNSDRSCSALADEWWKILMYQLSSDGVFIFVMNSTAENQKAGN